MFPDKYDLGPTLDFDLVRHLGTATEDFFYPASEEDDSKGQGKCGSLSAVPRKDAPRCDQLLCCDSDSAVSLIPTCRIQREYDTPTTQKIAPTAPPVSTPLGSSEIT